MESPRNNVLNLGQTEVGGSQSRPGVFGASVESDITRGPIRRLVPLPDGRVLFGTGSQGDQIYPMVGRLSAEGRLDPTFGVGGLVEERDGRKISSCDPMVQCSWWEPSPPWRVPRPRGIAELSPTDHRVERNFPLNWTLPR